MFRNNYAKKYLKKLRKQLGNNPNRISYLSELPKTIFHKLKYTDKFYKCHCAWCIDSRLLQDRKTKEIVNDMLNDYENEKLDKRY
jgi:hypothetical protein